MMMMMMEEPPPPPPKQLLLPTFFFLSLQQQMTPNLLHLQHNKSRRELEFDDALRSLKHEILPGGECY
jgi:hypothetical protein